MFEKDPFNQDQVSLSGILKLVRLDFKKYFIRSCLLGVIFLSTTYFFKHKQILSVVVEFPLYPFNYNGNPYFITIESIDNSVEVTDRALQFLLKEKRESVKYQVFRLSENFLKVKFIDVKEGYVENEINALVKLLNERQLRMIGSLLGAQKISIEYLQGLVGKRKFYRYLDFNFSATQLSSKYIQKEKSIVESCVSNYYFLTKEYSIYRTYVNDPMFEFLEIEYPGLSRRVVNCFNKQSDYLELKKNIYLLKKYISEYSKVDKDIRAIRPFEVKGDEYSNNIRFSYVLCIIFISFLFQIYTSFFSIKIRFNLLRRKE